MLEEIEGDSKKQGEPLDCNLLGIQISSYDLLVLFLINVCLVVLKGEITCYICVMQKAFSEM